jgi:hypothetical protein
MRCTGPFESGLRAEILMSAAEADGAGTSAALLAARGQELARAESVNDLRWKRKEQVANRGRGMAARNLAYGAIASGIFGDLARRAGEAAAGYMEYLGWRQTRFQPEYVGEGGRRAMSGNEAAARTVVDMLRENAPMSNSGDQTRAVLGAMRRELG